MELIDIQLSVKEDKSKVYEISYRTDADAKLSMLAIDFDSVGGNVIEKASIGLQRGTVSQDDFIDEVLKIVKENSGAGIHEVLNTMKLDETTPISARIKIVDGMYITVDGKEVTGPLSTQILKMAKARMRDESKVKTEDWLALINFTELLFDNVNERVREQLYDWLMYQVRNGRLTLTTEGKFLGYKGVRRSGDDLVSIHSGPGFVNGVHKNGNLENNPGNVLEMEREGVDADPNVTCSTGLHVGSYDYANSFGNGCVILVEVDPRDVISVPYDYNGQKIRTCKYKVIKEVDSELEEFSFNFTENAEETIPALPASNEAPSPLCYSFGKDTDEYSECEYEDDYEYEDEDDYEEDNSDKDFIVEHEDLLSDLMFDETEVMVDTYDGLVVGKITKITDNYIEVDNERVEGLLEIIEVTDSDYDDEEFITEHIDELYDYLLNEDIVKVVTDTDVFVGKISLIKDDVLYVEDNLAKNLVSVELAENTDDTENEEVKEDHSELIELLTNSLLSESPINFQDTETDDFYLFVTVKGLNEEKGYFTIEQEDKNFYFDKVSIG